MATPKQKLAFDKMVENGGIASRAMIDAGYSPETAKVPGKFTKSKGFLEICEETGLTPNLITESLVDDIRSKPKRRIRELELGSDILGMRKTQPTNSVNIVVFPTELIQKNGIQITPSAKPDSE